MKQSFQIVSFLDDKFTPHSVKRLSDGEVFTIGDFVTNGSPMKGIIEEFQLFNKEEMFVKTDWSGIGMHLDDLKREVILPSAYFIDQVIEVRIETKGGAMATATGTVKAVHFYGGAKKSITEKYDIDLWYEGGNTSHRIYNVPLTLLKAV